MSITIKGVAQRTLATLTMAATVLTLAGFSAMPIAAQAVAPADYGLHEGDTISAAGSNDPDIYIVNDWGYKRLFLNPAIFTLYGHLSWAGVKTVSPATRDAFVTSGLFRNCETGDQKVYGLESTGEDTAVLHWVNVSGADAVAQDANFFKKVFCINSAEQALYGMSSVNYTALNQIPVYVRGGTVVAGAFGASLASDNPASGTVVLSQALADLAHFSISGSGVVHQLTLKRIGISSDDLLSNVYLFVNGKRVTDGSTFGSGIINFNDANGLFTAPATVVVKTDVGATGSGQTVGVQLTSLENAAVSVSGNIMSVAAAPSGLSSVALTGLLDAGASIDPQSDVRVWQANANISGHDVLLKRLSLREIGSINYSDINNFRLFVDGVQVAQTQSLDSNGYATFLPNVTVKVGGARVFKVLADVNGGANRTFSFQLKGAYDVEVMDTNVGIGVVASGAVLGAQTTVCTVSGSPYVSITKKTDSPSGDIVKGSTSVTLATYTAKAYGESIKIDTLGALASVSGGFTGKLRYGHLLIDGAQYGSTQSLDSAATTSFTINYTFQPGVEHVISIVADLYDTVGGADLAAGKVVSAVLDAPSGQLVQGVSSGQSLAATPAGSKEGNNFTVVTGSLSFQKNNSYADQNIVPPQNTYLLGEWDITGPATEGVNVNTLSFDPAFNTGFAATDITNMYVVYGGTQSATKGTISAGANDYSVSLSVAPSQTVVVKLYGNVGATVTGGDVTFTATVTGTTAVSGAAANAGPSVGQKISFATGSFIYTRDGSSPVAQNVFDNQAVTAAAFKFTATNDSFNIKKLVFTMGDQPASASGITSVDLLDGSTVVATMPASISMTFNLPAPYVPVAAGASKVLTVRLNLASVATPGGGTSAADHAVTLASGTALQGSTGVESAITAGAATAGRAVVAYASIPTITLQALPATSLAAGTKTISKFSIATAGGDISWKSFTLDIASSSAVTGVTGAKVYDSSHTEIAGGWFTTASASLSGALHGRSVFVATDEQQISGSETYTVEATVAVGTLTAGSFLSTTMPSIATQAVSSTYSGGALALSLNLAGQSFIWSDLSTTSPAHGVTLSPDWHNDYLVKNLPAASQTLSY